MYRDGEAAVSEQERTTPSLSVIVPVFNGGRGFSRCLRALCAAGGYAELLVVDDGSTDGSAEPAARLGARVLVTENGPRGPAHARNLGAAAAHGEVLVFVDADVAVHQETPQRIAARMSDPSIAAVFGAYDTAPPARSLVSQYKNLLHHYVHTRAAGPAQTFWAGCGAVRREAFELVGGFDATFVKPGIEDIELGLRLHDAGFRILIDPAIQGTHLKRWTYSSWLKTDIFSRAVPWSRLIASRKSIPATLNLGYGARLAAVAVWLMVVGLILGPWSAAGWVGALAALGVIVFIHRHMLHYFSGLRGPFFAVGALGLHIVYLLYSSATFGLVLLAHWTGIFRPIQRGAVPFRE